MHCAMRLLRISHCGDFESGIIPKLECCVRRTAHGAGISGSVGGVRASRARGSGAGARGTGHGEAARAAGAGAAGASRGGRGAAAARVRAPQPIDRAPCARTHPHSLDRPTARPDSQTAPRRNPLPTLDNAADNNTKALNFLQNGLSDFPRAFRATLASPQKGITRYKRVLRAAILRKANFLSVPEPLVELRSLVPVVRAMLNYWIRINKESTLYPFRSGGMFYLPRVAIFL